MLNQELMNRLGRPGRKRLRWRVLLLCSFICQVCSAQIIYVTPGPNDGNGLPTTNVRIANPDGTNVRPVNLPGVPAALFPVASQDGRFVAFSARNPLRPLEQSQSVIALDRTTGQITRLIDNRDRREASGEVFKFLPNSKAFSPDNRFMAVSTRAEGVPQPGDTAGPIALYSVDIYDLTTVTAATTALPTRLLFTTPPVDGIHTAGVGIDWSPSGARIAVPRVIVGPNQVQQITPIFLIDPQTGGTTQLTQPSERFLQRDIANIVTYEEHDYAPVFSPNGVGLAYLRVAQIFSVNSPPQQNPRVQASIRITRVDGSNDREVFTFNEGLIPNTVQWSPDGSQLVVDMAPRATLAGFPLLLPDASQIAVYTLNVDGSAFTRIASAPAATPAWLPAAPPSGNGQNSSVSAPAAAILPGSRSAVVNSPVTVFATLLNTSQDALRNCGIELADQSLPISFAFQTTDAQTNATVGSENARVDVNGNAAQTFLLRLTPTSTFAPRDVAFNFKCDNADSANTVARVNTLLLSAASSPVADIVALVATSSGDGILDLSGSNQAGAFALASVNVGANSQIEVRADSPGVDLGLSLTLCQTNPATGQCLSAPAGSVTTQVGEGATPTFSVFAQANSAIAFDPANNRVRVRFISDGVTRGAASVAVRTR